MPGMRMLERYAVLLGGGRNSRFGLDDGVVITANHVAIAGGVATAVKNAKEKLGKFQKIEIQVSNESDLKTALNHGADILLLDGLMPEAVAGLVTIAREISPTVAIECSGNISLENVRSYAEAGANVISVSALTNSAPAMNVSFVIQPA